MLVGLPIEILSAEEANVTGEAAEDGATFAENAIKKARYVVEQTGKWAMADDSGLCTDALNGAPGVLTARWAGGRDLIEYTLDKMGGIPESRRQAHFESAVALVAPDGTESIFSGRVSGSLALTPRGVPRLKLPYDVLFIPDGYNQTFAEMSSEQKNAISHRGLAFQKLKKFLEEIK